MTVLLTTFESCDDWLDGSVAEAVAMQRLLPAKLLQPVAIGPHADFGLRSAMPLAQALRLVEEGYRIV